MSSTAPSRVFPTGRTLLQALAIGRWGCWAWMVGIIVFSGDSLRHPVVAWVAITATLASAIDATIALRTRPERLVMLPRVLADVALAIALTALDGYVFAPGHVFVTSEDFATEWTLIAVASAGVAFGPIVAAACGSSYGPARWLAALLNGFHHIQPRHIVSMVATSLFYGSVGAVFGWMTHMMRRAEIEIGDRKARDEIARVMHDTVLQTLAVVDRRTRESDPALAAMARDADRDVRRYLFSRPPGATGLAETIRAAVERGAVVRDAVDRDGSDAPVEVTVNVVDDGSRLDPGLLDAVSRAVGQAVANAVEHAAANHIIVFAETDDTGQVFASVRDDGHGFDVDAPRSGHGVDESIIARMESIGGRAIVSSTLGHGTDVRLWTG